MDQPPERAVDPSSHQAPGARERRPGDVVAVVVGVALSAAILLRYYDRMWIPGDDGYYAHIAQRILNGEVLHRDIQAMHPGYVYFVDALALRVFGHNLVSLRYPLVALGVVQAALVGALFVRRSRVGAVAAAVLFTSLSYVLFPTPSVHWYCQFVLILIVCALRWIPRESPYRPLVAGFLVGVEGFLRQLTGAFVGVGVATYLLAEASSPPGEAAPQPKGGSAGAARGVIGAFALLLGAYLFLKSAPLAAVLFGAGVPLLLAATGYRAAAGGRETLTILLRLAAGAALAAAPLLAYHLLHGSLDDWFHDSVVAALGLSEMEYVKVRRYAGMLRQAVGQLVPRDPGKFVNGVFWITLMAAPLAVALATVRGVLRNKAVHPLPFLAVFYAPVAVHYEAPAYLLFAAAPVVVGLAWFVPTRGPKSRWVVGAAALAAGAMSVVALRYHAGQPVARLQTGAVAGQIRPLVPAGIDRIGLRISGWDADTHARLLEVIRRETSPTDAILAVPGDAEVYFLSQRRNPTPYAYLVYGVMAEESLQRVLDTLRRDPPVLVIHVPYFPFNTPNTDRVMAEVKSQYTLIAEVGQFDVYRRNGHVPPVRPE